MRIGIIAALPGELKPLVKGWERMPVARGSGLSMWRRMSPDGEVIAVCGGMGAAAARRAFTAAEFLGSLDCVLSVGWAGALLADCRPGECYAVSEIVDAQTGERFHLAKKERPFRLVTCARVASEAEKRRLASSYGAALVDMEAAAVARLAQMRGVPMNCFKAVSDGVGAMLPDLNPYIDVAGQLRLAPLLAHVALRPRYWPSLLQLGGDSREGARTLAETVEAFLIDKDIAAKQSDGGTR